ncbi:MAG TPA: nucleotide sugar dehydrogenase [Planctomycetota bacterium]|nr:nucleotide sugar dehydrogenase [Planctomycetota bacterium]
MAGTVALDQKIAQRTARIAVLGQGYVGLPVALALAAQGFSVVGFDTNVTRAAALTNGISDIKDVPNSQLADAIRAGKYRASADAKALDGCDVAILCVPTPITKAREPDLSCIQAATKTVAEHFTPGMLVVLESTTYPGTTHEILLPAFAAGGREVGRDFFLAFSPERIDPGNKWFTLADIPKVVSGTTPACLRLTSALYQTIVKTVVPVSSPRAAEMVKVVENTVRAVNIALVNELALLCDRMGLNVWEVLDAAYTKPFGLLPYYPGPGVGGHCIAVDPHYLEKKAYEMNFSTRFITLATEINRHMPEFVVAKAGQILNQAGVALSRAKVLVLGVAYKADVSDYRESPALDVLQDLQKAGVQVVYHDSQVPEIRHESWTLVSVPLTEALLKAQDLVIITTAHSGIDYGWVVQHSTRVLDTRNATKRLTQDRGKITLL